MQRKLWIVVLCAAVMLGISIGLRQSLGLFLLPVSQDLGLGREVFALAAGLMNLVWGLFAPLAGAVADRFGAGRAALAGGICYAAGLTVMAWDGAGGQLLAGGLLMGLGLSGTGFTVVLGAVGRAAPAAQRSQALAVASVGGSIGQFVALPYTHLLIERFGWSLSLMALAATALCMVALAGGLRGTGFEATEAAPQSVAAALREACGRGDFLLLTAGFFVCGFQLAFIAVHLPAVLGDRGLPSWLAASALTLVGICNIFGTYLCGWLGGRFRKKSVLSLLYLARAAIFLIFILIPLSETSVLVFAAAMGLLWLGTVPLTVGIVATLFGMVHVSMLFGIVFLSHQLGGFLGAWLAGVLYDSFSSYEFMWWLNIGLGLLAALLHWPIDERPAARPSPVGAPA